MWWCGVNDGRWIWKTSRLMVLRRVSASKAALSGCMAAFMAVVLSFVVVVGVVGVVVVVGGGGGSGGDGGGGGGGGGDGGASVTAVAVTLL